MAELVRVQLRLYPAEDPELCQLLAKTHGEDRNRTLKRLLRQGFLMEQGIQAPTAANPTPASRIVSPLSEATSPEPIAQEFSLESLGLNAAAFSMGETTE